MSAASSWKTFNIPIQILASVTLVPVPSDLCAERKFLSDAVVKAIGEFYRAKQEYNLAKAKRPEAVDDLALVLQKARAEERVASRALADHIKEHGCERQRKGPSTES